MSKSSFKKVIKQHRRRQDYERKRNLLRTEVKEIKHGSRRKISITFPIRKKLTSKKPKVDTKNKIV
jgi:hypothetical protein